MYITKSTLNNIIIVHNVCHEASWTFLIFTCGTYMHVSKNDRLPILKPHCIRCSHFKVDDVNALEPSSKPPVHIVEDNVTASLHQQRDAMTLVTAWMPWRRDVDLLVPAGTSTRLDWIQCGFKQQFCYNLQQHSPLLKSWKKWLRLFCLGPFHGAYIL
jgi:hypothetical protein